MDFEDLMPQLTLMVRTNHKRLVAPKKC